MGKGNNAFYKFIDESYFAFWFKQWSAFFLIVGILLIIAGIVVYEVYPASQASTFAKDQIVTSPSDPNYNAWVNQDEFVQYSFLSINPNLTCQVVGPFVFAVAAVKTQVSFSGSKVSYVQTKTKTFVPSQSANPLATINGLNPPYIWLIQNKTSEASLFEQLYQQSTIVSDLKNFYAETAPLLLGSRAIGQTFQTTLSQTQKNTIFPAIFQTGLTAVISNYPLRYLSQKAPLVPVPFVGSADDSLAKGIYNILFQAFENCTTTAAKDIGTFAAQFTTGFPDTSPGNCSKYLQSHALTPSYWPNSTQAEIFFNSLTASPNYTLWFDANEPLTKGLCGNPRSAHPSEFPWMELTQLNDICDNLFQGFFTEFLPTGLNQTQLGLARFCSGPLEQTSFWGLGHNVAFELNIGLASYVNSFDLSLSPPLENFNQVICQNYVNALNDITGFVSPAYAGTLTSYPPLTSSDISTLQAYLSPKVSVSQQWFTSLWLTSSLGCTSSTGCYFISFADAGVDSSDFGSADFPALTNLLFPEPSNFLQNYYAISNPNPKPSFQTSMFTPISDASGILSLTLALNNVTYMGGVFGSTFSISQFDTLVTYANAAVQKWYSTGTSASPATAENVGYLQFAQGNLACGPSFPNTVCSVESELFGIQSSYYPELPFAVNASVANNYYNSFVASDVNTVFSISTVSNLFTALTSSSSSLVNQNPPNTNSKYFYFLLSSYVRGSFPSSGAIVPHLAVDWADGVTDPTVSTYGGSNQTATFAYDPDGVLHQVEVSTALSTAFTFLEVDGSAAITAYPTPETVLGLLNPDGFPPGQVSQGSTAKVLDLTLLRSFNFVFGTTTANLNGITASIGTVQSSDWAVNSIYGIQTANFMPSLLSPFVTVSPCAATLNNACEFPSQPAAATTDLFATSQTIYSDLATGLIAKYQSCVVYSVSSGPNAFPFTAPTLLPNTVFSQLQKQTSTILSDQTASSYVAQFTGVKNTALAVLLALVIVGGLFALTGVVLLVFWFIRRSRKNKAQSQLELVHDPFGEKQSNIGNMKY